MSEHTTVWLALDYDLWGTLRLPWPMTSEQWERLEEHLPLIRRAFVREGPATQAGPPQEETDV